MFTNSCIKDPSYLQKNALGISENTRSDIHNVQNHKKLHDWKPPEH